MDLRKIIAELSKEKILIERTIIRLETRLGRMATPKSRRGRRSMTEAERRQVSERMKKYWSQRRADGASAAAMHEFASNTLLEIASETTEIILIADHERRYVEVSQAASATLALPRESIVGRKIEDFFAEAIGESISAAWSRFVADGEQTGICRLLDGSGALFEYKARVIAPGLHVSVLRPIASSDRPNT